MESFLKYLNCQYGAKLKDNPLRAAAVAAAPTAAVAAVVAATGLWIPCCLRVPCWSGESPSVVTGCTCCD